MHSGDSRVFLWRHNDTTPRHILSGHSEAVLDLQWLDSSKLATWSKDRTLRIWVIDKQLQSDLGAEDLSGVGIDDASFGSMEDLSLEESMEIPASQQQQQQQQQTPQKIDVAAIVDSTASLPILRPHNTSSTGDMQTQSRRPLGKTGSSSSAGDIHPHNRSPSTRSLTSLAPQAEFSLSSSVLSPVFPATQSLAQEFAELKAESIPKLEIERVGGLREGGESVRERERVCGERERERERERESARKREERERERERKRDERKPHFFPSSL